MEFRGIAYGTKNLTIMPFVDTHTHIYGEEFDADRKEVVERAIDAGAKKLFLPNENLQSLSRVLQMSREYPGVCYPMIGLHPEEIDQNYESVLNDMESLLQKESNPFIAIGEVGIDFHFRQDNADIQIAAFCRQAEWARQYSLPLMIHSRDSIETLSDTLLKNGGNELSGVFHCFSGTEQEAQRLLAFPGFALGIGGIVTFKRSTLPQVLKNTVPLDRIVLETDSPYMAPVPVRGKRNESAFIPYIAAKIAEIYEVSIETVYQTTNRNAKKIFPEAFE